jgi:hypothetical protein
MHHHFMGESSTLKQSIKKADLWLLVPIRSPFSSLTRKNPQKFAQENTHAGYSDFSSQ